jgi:hypothetical protein
VFTSSMYSASSVSSALANPLQLQAGQRVVVPISLMNETNTAVNLLPWHAVMLQFRKQDVAAGFAQGVALSGSSHRSSSFTLTPSLTSTGLYSLHIAVVECATVLIEYSHMSDGTMDTSQRPMAVAGALFDSPVAAIVTPQHWPLNLSVNAYLVVPNRRENLRVQALFNQPFSLFFNARKLWECRSIDCDSGALDLGPHNTGDVILLKLAFSRVTASSKFSLLWNAGSHPVAMEAVLAQHACSSPFHDINTGATLVSVSGASLQAASTRVHWHSSVVSQYCTMSLFNWQDSSSQSVSVSPHAFNADSSACIPRVSSGTLLSFAAFFHDSYENLVSPDFSNLAVFLASDDCDMEASIASYGIDTGDSVSFSVRVIRSTLEQTAAIRLRQLSSGLLTTYYRDSAAVFTSVASSMDWSSTGNFPGDSSVQIWSAKWAGFLKSPSSGAWTLTISKPQSSSDSVQLQIGRFSVHLGASSSSSLTFDFSIAMFLSVSVLYSHFAGSSSSGLTLSWKSEGMPSFVAIPSSAFFSQSWSFTSNLKVYVRPGPSRSCQAHTPAISVATAGLSSTFIISAIDSFGNPVTDVSHIKLRMNQLSGCDTLVENSCVQLSRSMDLFGLQVSLTLSGLYQLQIVDSERNYAACTSFSQIYVHPNVALLTNSRIRLISATVATAGTALQFEITTLDQFSNAAPLLASYAQFSFKLSCSGPSPCCDPCVASRSTCASSILCVPTKTSIISGHFNAPSDLSSHIFTVSFLPSQSGFFRLQVSSSQECPYCDALPANAFWDVFIKPSLHSAVNLDASPAVLSMIAGDSLTISGRSFDVYGNVVLAPDPPSQVHCVSRLNQRSVAGVSSHALLSSNFYISCTVSATKSGRFELSMISFQREALKISTFHLIPF